MALHFRKGEGTVMDFWVAGYRFFSAFPVIKPAGFAYRARWFRLRTGFAAQPAFRHPGGQRPTGVGERLSAGAVAVDVDEIDHVFLPIGERERCS